MNSNARAMLFSLRLVKGKRRQEVCVCNWQVQRKENRFLRSLKVYRRNKTHVLGCLAILQANGGELGEKEPA